MNNAAKILSILALALVGCAGAPDDSALQQTPPAPTWFATVACATACPWASTGALQAQSRDEAINWTLDQIGQYAATVGPEAAGYVAGATAEFTGWDGEIMTLTYVPASSMLKVVFKVHSAAIGGGGSFGEF